MIPEQLQSRHLIRVCKPDCETHSSCNSPGKRPVSSTESEPSFETVRSWIKNGGNYGVVADGDEGLIIWDSDSKEFSSLLKSNLPSTFTVESGGDGWGEHLYYRVNGTVNRQSDWSDPEGSVRVKNWHAVGPGSSHPSGGQYRIVEDKPVATVSAEDIEEVINKLNRRSSVQSRGSGGSSAAPPAAPSSQAVDSLNFIRRDDKRREISEILTTNSEHSRRVWAVGWLHAAAGLSADEIVSIIVKEASWPNLDRDVVETQVQSVIDSSRSSRGTHYTEFGTADMDAEASERRKTENVEDRESSTNMEVSNMSETDYSTLEKVTVTESNDPSDGDQCIRAMVTEASGDERYQFVQILAGTIEEDPEFGISPNWQTNGNGQQKTRTIGNADPDYLRSVAESLTQLADEIEEE